MVQSPILWKIAIRLPALLPDRTLHRAGLHAAAAGQWAVADALFDRAAAKYRVNLEVEALARLRVHQLIVRARATRDPLLAASLRLEVEQRLARLDQVESLEPPFEPMPASHLLARWVLEAPSPPAGAPPGAAASRAAA